VGAADDEDPHACAPDWNRGIWAGDSISAIPIASSAGATGKAPYAIRIRIALV
jgi:hypothetical protein